jgi:hypothetical protein
MTPSQLVGEIVTANLAALNVGTIWIVSCDAASSEKGQSYCQTLANVAGTQVIASDSPLAITNTQGMNDFLQVMDNVLSTAYLMVAG